MVERFNVTFDGTGRQKHRQAKAPWLRRNSRADEPNRGQEDAADYAPNNT